MEKAADSTGNLFVEVQIWDFFRYRIPDWTHNGKNMRQELVRNLIRELRAMRRDFPWRDPRSFTGNLFVEAQIRDIYRYTASGLTTNTTYAKSL